ncbi:hypothetical protein DL96DRAFT_1617386 [Flagelloscypha sp. PMI_526]|nr:hypothetical protein DL96DRAFT_1617386 [Flagelloscypha sp. PMI_526]
MAAGSSTLSEYVEKQDSLLKEAAEAIPHSFSQCTYDLGHIRQALYLCRTCPENKGICAACSVACHTDHDQIELFPKRDFRCDCPTSSIAHKCTLHPQSEDPNVDNKYGRNFEENWCRCGRKYDANTEREAMIQCLSCEDWFHESCCNLRERPSSREPTPAPPKEAEQQNEGDDAASEASSSGLPPPLISGDDYESFICGECVSNIPILKDYAGQPGYIIVVRDSPDDPWKILEGSQPPATNEDADVDVVSIGRKRSRSPSSGELEAPDAKRAKLEDGASGCKKPVRNSTAQEILAASDKSLGAGDVFLTEGFREKWCRCRDCEPQLLLHSYLMNEEETYEPPEDPDIGLSLEQLGLRALEQMPREKAINGIHAFNKMRDTLVNYLKPFAENGEVVKEDDVKSFFEELQKNKV